MDLKLCENSDAENVVSRHFSRADTIGTSISDGELLQNWSWSRVLDIFTVLMIETYFQRPLSCAVIEQGTESKMLRVEVYPLEFRFCLEGSEEEKETNCVAKSFSRATTIGISVI